MNLIEKSKRIAGGAVILTEWLGSGGEVVSIDLAQQRTIICKSCPFNQPGSFLTESIAKAIKNQVDLRNKLGLKTKGMKSLKSCQICNCYLPLKIFIPIERIKPLPDDNFPSFCWLVKESTPVPDFTEPL